MEFGAIDVLVNNAGAMWTRFDRVEDPSIFETLMRLNYLGSVYPTLHALPHLKRSRGRIVAVSSMAGLIGVPERAAYAASKHAVTGSSIHCASSSGGVVSRSAHPPRLRRLGNPSPRAGPDGRPAGDNPMAGSRIMTAERCAELMVGAIARRDRALITSARGRLRRWLRLLRKGDRRIARRARSTDR